MSNLPPLPDGFVLPDLPDGFQLEGAAPSASAEDPNRTAARQFIESHPAYKKQGAMDYARMAAHGATLGLYEPAVAAAASGLDMLRHGGDFSDYYGKERALQDEYLANARENTGWAGTGLEFAGSALPVSKIAGIAGNAVKSPLAASMLTGATAGGVQSYNEGQDPLAGTLLGGVGGGVGHGVVSGVSKLAGLANRAPSIDTLDAIKGAADAARQQFTSAPVRYSERGIQTLGDNVRNLLTGENYNARAHTNLARSGALEMLDDLKYGRAMPSTGAAAARTPMDLHQIEQVLSGVARGGGEDGRIAQLLRDEVAGFMRNPSSFDVAASTGGLGPRAARAARAAAARGAQAARSALDESNAQYTKFYKGKAVQDATEYAAERAAKTGSGGNRENTLRQEIDKLIKSRRDWTPDEMDALQKVVFGAGPLHNQGLRLVGKASPEGNGLSFLLHLMGGTLSHGMTLPFAVAGTAAKYASEKITKGHVAQLDKIIRAGGKRSNAFAADNAVQRGLKKARPTIAGLLGTGGELY